MRVRFAPSPTGYLHVGGLRTALFNYLLARQTNGAFILRIEDTDQSRKVEGAVQALIESLRWTGLDYDEGPDKNGGHEPYFQSERLELYRRHIDQLIQNDHAYYCFCSSERLEEVRNHQIATKQQAGYDGHCRYIAKTEAATRARNEPFVVRMKIPESGELKFEDRIRGKISYPLNQMDDQVLLKSDGFPTYHLANVVDDHFMGVNMVIRGEEWLPSTPKHILLYQYFGWDLPEFAHLPLLLNEDRSKLSKRQGDVAVEDYRAKGILPEALVNFVALLGWNPGDDREIFSLDELIRTFSLERVNKAGAVFNIEKLYWMNGQYLRSLEVNDYLNRAKAWLADLNFGNASDDLLLLVRDSLTTLADLPNHLGPLIAGVLDITDSDAIQILDAPATGSVLDMAIEIINNRGDSPIDSEFIGSMMKQIQNQTGVRGKNLWMPVRVALTGKIHGPELGKIAEIYGNDKFRQRMQKAKEIRSRRANNNRGGIR